jgi:ribosomal protein S18 acetylase RimI-like enzyme
VTFTVRDAQLDDADAIGAVQVTGWREAYPHLLSDASLERATPEWRADRWRAILSDSHDTRVRVAEIENEIVGFASAGPAMDLDSPRSLELYSIYLLQKAQGSGAGQAMLDAVIDDQPACLWVAVLNPRAQSFYRRNGFTADGTRKIAPFIFDKIAEFRMVR